MDRGHVDFGRLYHLQVARAFFVVRARGNLRFVRHVSHAGSGYGVRRDQRGVLRSAYARERYPEKLRRVCVVDPDTGLDLVLLS